MNKKFFSKLTSYIDHCQEKLNTYNRELDEKGLEWADMDEDQKTELITRETEINVVKWVRDLYLECLD